MHEFFLLLLPYHKACMYSCVFSLRGGVVWVDNFSQILAWAIPDNQRESFRACLWTVEMCKGHPLCRNQDMMWNMSYHEDGSPFEAMPTSFLPYIDSQITYTTDLSLTVNRNQYADALCVKAKLQNIPLKFHPTTGWDEKSGIPKAEWESARRIAPLKPDGARFMTPKMLYAYNIGSNAGLVMYLRKYYNDNKSTHRYGVLISDCNIFFRTVKVKTSHMILGLLFLIVCQVIKTQTTKKKKKKYY